MDSNITDSKGFTDCVAALRGAKTKEEILKIMDDVDEKYQNSGMSADVIEDSEWPRIVDEISKADERIKKVVEIIENITNIWGGTSIVFPIIRNRGDRTHIYKREGQREAYAVIATYKVDEDWKGTPDIMIDAYEFKDLLDSDDLFTVPVIIAVQYNDMQVFAPVSKFYLRRKEFYHKGNVFLPKVWFDRLIGKKKNAA